MESRIKIIAPTIRLIRAIGNDFFLIRKNPTMLAIDAARRTRNNIMLPTAPNHLAGVKKPIISITGKAYQIGLILTFSFFFGINYNLFFSIKKRF